MPQHYCRTCERFICSKPKGHPAFEDPFCQERCRHLAEMAKWIAIMAETLSTMAALHGKPSAATPNEMEEMAKEARTLLARVRGEGE